MDNTVYFYSHNPNRYKKDNWRHVFSQWYIKPFSWANAIYDLSEIVDNEYVKELTFNCRETWMMLYKALMFAKGRNKKFNLNVACEVLKTKNQKEKLLNVKLEREGGNKEKWKEHLNVEHAE